jgi:coenzyme PQQ precursor peptide PqqA
MTPQNLSPTPQQNSTAPQVDARHPFPTRTIAEWETPEVEEFELCFEVTAYIYHWK